MATVSPSRTRSAIASRIVATLEVLIGSIARAAGAAAQPPASTSWSAPAADLARRPRRRCPRRRRPPRAKIRRAVAISASLTVSGRRHPDARLAALEDEQAALEAGPLDLLGVLGRVELDAEHQALAADVADEPAIPARPAGAAGAVPARRGRAALSIEPALEQVDRRERRGARDRVAAVGRAVGAGTPAPPSGPPRATIAPSGMPRRDALGREQDVRLDAPVLDRPHLPGPAGARLDLVGDEQDAVLVADARAGPGGSRPRGRCSRPRPGSARR